MQYKLDLAASVGTCVRIANISLDEFVPGPSALAHSLSDLLEVSAMSGGKIVDANNLLVVP
jgi:hypothetical protein